MLDYTLRILDADPSFFILAGGHIELVNVVHGSLLLLEPPTPVPPLMLERLDHDHIDELRLAA